jgi:NADH-quinone oxidoreductase subunit E
MSHATPPTPKSRGPREWSPEQRAKIDQIVARYPTKKSAIMPVLWLAQESWDWLDLDVMRLVARTLDLPPSHVHAVASFYTMFKKEPTGKYVIDVCHTLSCWLAGADRIVAHLEKVLEVDAYGNSKDGLFTIHRVECLASCGSAPMMQVNDHFYELLTPERVDEIVAAFRAGSPLSTPRPEAHEWQWNSPRS